MPITVRVAAVDFDDQGELKCIKVFLWDRTFDLFGRHDKKVGVLLKKLGLKRYPDRWVDVTDRPDIAEGEPFPFVARDI